MKLCKSSGYLALIFLISVVFNCSAATPFVDSKAILDKTGIGQYEWGNYGGTVLKDYINRGEPLNASWYVWYHYHRFRDADAAVRDLNKIINAWDLYETHQLTYKDPWNNIPAGWWSSMDMMLLPMTLIEVGNNTENEDFIELGKKMINLAIKSPEQGGSLWPDTGNGCWFSEYSWPGMDREVDEYFVLNGHLFSLTALKIMADALKDPDLQDIYECGAKATKLLADKFANDKDWPRYMLVPNTINPPHYVIFEMIQFQDLYRLTGDGFYEEQRVKRSEVIKRQYPVYRVTGKGREFLFFSSIGAPHPYNPDLFSTSLRCLTNKDSPLEARQIGSVEHWKNNFQFIDISNTSIKSCEVYSVRSDGVEHALYSTNAPIDVNDDLPIELTYSTEATLDAYRGSSGSISIHPLRQSSDAGEASYLDTEGRITVKFSQQPLSDRTLLGLEIRSSSDIKIGILYWQGERVISRYYPIVKRDVNNLLVVSHLGFDDAHTIDAVDQITIRVYTDNLQENVDLELGKLFIFNNQHELYNVLKSNESQLLIKIE